MRRIAFFLFAAAFLPLVTQHGFATPTPNPTVNAPSATRGGGLVVITGSSPSGEAGTTFYVSDDNGKIDIKNIEWDGTEFTVQFKAPRFNPEEPDNEIEILVKPTAPSRRVSELIQIRA